MKKRNKAINSFLAVTAMAWLGQSVSADTPRRISDPPVDISQTTQAPAQERK